MSGFEIRLGLIRPRGEDPRPVGSPIPDASITTLAAARHPCNLYYVSHLGAGEQLLAEPCPSTAATDWQRRAAGLRHLPPAATPAACLAASFPPLRTYLFEPASGGGTTGHSVCLQLQLPLLGLLSMSAACALPAQWSLLRHSRSNYKATSHQSFSPSPRLRAPV